jgi:hypothetical protein
MLITAFVDAGSLLLPPALAAAAAVKDEVGRRLLPAGCDAFGLALTVLNHSGFSVKMY